MTENEKQDQILQQMQELTTTIKDHMGDTSTLDLTQLEGIFTAQMEELKGHLDGQLPDRQGLTNVDTKVLDAAERRVKELPDTNRFKKMALDMARDGHQKWGNLKLTPADLWLSIQVMEGSKAIQRRDENFPQASDDLVNAVKALSGFDTMEKLMDPGNTGGGAEFTFTGLDSNIWEDFFAASRIAADMNVVPMTTDPFKIPAMADPTWRKGAAGQPTAEQDPETSNVTLTSTEQILDIAWTYDMNEESVLAIAPQLRRNIARSGAEQMDAFALNADATATSTGNINLDDDTPDSDAYYLTNGQDGLRHLWLVDNTGQEVNVNGALDDAAMASILAKLGKYGLDYQNVRIVPSVQTYFKMLGLTNVATIDKYGPQAAIVSGELMRYRGIPVLPSVSQPDTEADGKVSVTAGNNTKGQITAYHSGMWVAGFPRRLMIEMDRDIRGRQLIMVASFKMAVAAYGTRSAATHTAGGRNITL